jgi:hypothetical protein
MVKNIWISIPTLPLLVLNQFSTGATFTIIIIIIIIII